MKKRNAKVFALFMSVAMAMPNVAAAMPVYAAPEFEDEADFGDKFEEEFEAEAEEEVEAEDTTDADDEFVEETEDADLNEKSETAVEIDAGDCGEIGKEDSVSYKVYSDGTVEILAHGTDCKMADYAAYDQTPWYDSGVAITTVEIAGDVIYVGKHAFDGVKTIQTVWFSEYVETVGDYAFQDCEGLTKVEFTDQDKIAVKEYGVGCFKNCTALRTITWGNNLEKVDEEAFYNCKSLVTDLNFAIGLKSIDDAAFWGCSSLKRLQIPYTVEKIGGNDICTNEAEEKAQDAIAASGLVKKEAVRGAFAYCTGLENVSFKVNQGRSVATIEGFAFYGDEKIGNIVVPGSVQEFGSYVFAACTGLSTAEIKGFETAAKGDVYSGIKKLHGTFMRCTNLTKVTIGTMVPEPVDVHDFDPYTGEAVFVQDYGCNVEEIGTRCFNDCTSLTEVNWPTNAYWSEIKLIGKEAFFRCSALKKIDLPKSLEELGESAFRNCYALDGLTVPGEWRWNNGVHTIGENCFTNCTSFTNIMLPKSLTLIKKSAFGCENDSNMKLVDVYYEGKKGDWEALVYDNTKTLEDNDLLTNKSGGYRSNVYFTSDELDIPTGLKATYVKKEVAEDDVVRVEWDEMKNSAGIEADHYELYVCHQAGIDYNGQMNFVDYIPVWTRVFEAPDTYYESLVANYQRGDHYYYRVRAFWENGDVAEVYGGRLCEKFDFEVPANREGIPVESITTDKNGYEIVVGKTTDIELTVAPTDYTDTKFSWTPDNPEVASVTVTSQDGKAATINALKEGVTAIEVKATNGVSTKFTVQVVPVGFNGVKKITLDKENITVNVNGTGELNITIEPTDADDTNFLWDTSNPKIASVKGTEDGKSATVTGLAVGECEITVSTITGEVKDTVTVKVEEAKIDPSVPRIVDGKVYVNGKEDATYDGLAQLGASDTAPFVYVEDGAQSKAKDGSFVDFGGGKFYIENGMVATEKSGLQADWGDIDEDGVPAWYFLADGQVVDYTGLAEYDGEWFYVENGRLDTKKAGYVKYDGSMFYVAAIAKSSK